MNKIKYSYIFKRKIKILYFIILDKKLKNYK